MMLVLVAVCVRVVMVKVAVVDPAGTVTDAGTLATAVVPLVNVTTTASVAIPDKVTVPVLFVPPPKHQGFPERCQSIIWPREADKTAAKRSRLGYAYLPSLRSQRCWLPDRYFVDDEVTDIQQTIWHHKRCRWFEKVSRARLATGKFPQNRSAAGINPYLAIEEVRNNQAVLNINVYPKCRDIAYCQNMITARIVLNNAGIEKICNVNVVVAVRCDSSGIVER